MWDQIPMSSDVADQYDRCSKNVKQHLGKSTKFLLPAQMGPDKPVFTALVDVSSFLTSLRMMKQWDDRYFHYFVKPAGPQGCQK